MDEWKEDFLRLLFPQDGTDPQIKKAYQLKYQNIPKSIFRYMKFDKDNRSIEHFKNNTVWLSNPSKFNDPFDSVFNIDFSRINRNSTIGHLVETAENNLKLPPEKIKEIKKSDKPYHVFNEQLLKKAGLSGELLKVRLKSVNDYCDSMSTEPRWNVVHDLRSIIRVCSFSETFNNVLMWAHYSDNHKGFCIEYDLSTGLENDINTWFLYPVKYSDDLTDFTNQFNFIESMEKVGFPWATKAAMSKAKEWSYESEWRLIVPSGLIKGKTHKFFAVKAVYIGAGIEEENGEEILTMAKSKKINVFRMYLSEKGFGLESEKIL